MFSTIGKLALLGEMALVIVTGATDRVGADPLDDYIKETLSDPSFLMAMDPTLLAQLQTIIKLHSTHLISDEQYKRSAGELIDSNDLYTNKCPRSAYVHGYIEFTYDKHLQSAVANIMKYYRITTNLNKYLWNNNTITGSTIVDESLAWPFVDILSATHLFIEVGRTGPSCPISIDTTVGFKHPEVTLQSPTINVDTVTRGSPSSGKILNYAATQDRVLEGQHYWEKLEVYLVTVPPSGQDQKLRVTAIVDGYFATGVGNNPPASSAYKSMEEQYYSELIKFTSIFFHNL